MDKVYHGETVHKDLSTGTTLTVSQSSYAIPAYPPPQYVQTSYNRDITAAPPQTSYNSSMADVPLPPPQASYNSNMANVPLPPPQTSYNSRMADVPLPPPQASYNSSMATAPLPPPQPSYNSNMATVPLPPPQPSYNSNPISAPFPPPQPNYNYHLGEAPSQPTVYGTYQNTGHASEVGRVHFPSYKEKSLVEAYLLAISPFGVLGAHHFYLNRYYWGIIYFFTLGLLGCGYIIDWFRIPCLVRQANDKIRNPEKDQKTISDAYVMWFPLGLLGFHHYYLGNYALGVLYTCTLGLFGIGWIIDAFRMPCLVRSANERRNLAQVEKKSVCLALALGISPLGVLGAHHYYLNRPEWGLAYTFTGGLLGIGWVVDWFRMPVLIKRANKVSSGERSNNVKTVDDAYILWFPFGLLGFHHFYLRRPVWGFVYFFTLGIVGLGWIIDICRIPWLVKETNLKIQAGQEQRPLIVSSSTDQVKEIPTDSIAGTAFAQGYQNYSTDNQVATAPTSWQHPSTMGAFGQNYQQGGYEYPRNGSLQFSPPINNMQPPPYQREDPSRVYHQSDDLVKN